MPVFFHPQFSAMRPGNISRLIARVRAKRARRAIRLTPHPGRRRFRKLALTPTVVAAIVTRVAAAQDSAATPVVLTSAPEVRLHLGGYIQTESRVFFGDVANKYTNEILFRRARLDLTGTIDKHFDIRFLPDFGQGTVVIQDAWLDVHYVNPLRLKIGKYKTPFGLEQNERATQLFFVERSLATDLAPNRDIGASLHGERIGRVLDYAAGIFNGVPDGVTADRGIGDTRDWEGRVLLHPFATSGVAALENLAVGGAGTIGRKDGTTATPDLPVYRSAGQQSPFFAYATGPLKIDSSVAAGAASRATGHGYWYAGRVGVLSEYVVSWQKVAREGRTGTVRNEGANATVSLELTPDHGSYQSVTPRYPFDPARGHWGALEAVGRYSTLHIGPTAFRDGLADPAKSARAASAWAYGANWVVNPWVRLQIDYERTRFVGGAPAGVNRQAENALLSEVQVSF